MAQRSGKIVFYEGKHFTGPKLEVGDCDNFQDRGFMNRVNSIHAESGPWVCFDHPDFRSQQFILEHGDYPDFFCWNGHNDHMGSRRPVGMIVFYEGKHFTGPKLEVGDCDNFQDRGFMNRVNSIHAESGPWVCFDHPDFRSQQFILEHGDYPDFFCWNGHNDHMGSRRPVGMSRGWPRSCVKAAKVYGMEREYGGWVLHEEPNYCGRMVLLERGDLGGFSDWEAHSGRVQSLRRVVNFF
ncbi:Gamma-crystallin N [Heterocephalus glaber]|uniref:Gamma-crystallin N n=1 Tax=Heterocephalus glaber TaxID=10181 RepID=G5AMU3_HETGA|nr:Gamma-crystallin N [Heterocephalus glaber]